MTPNKLYLIPTVIGDVPWQQVLPPANIDVVASIRTFIVEDVRTARRFLRKFGYTANFDEVTFLELNQHSKPEEISTYLNSIKQGSIGLLSEAGVPCVADPGAVIVKMAHEKNIEVVPLVGPSSILMGLMASGFNGQNFAFIGYLPIDKHERSKKIKELETWIYKNSQTQIFIETPYRNNALLDALFETCNPQTKLCIAANISMENQFIKTKSIADWKKSKPDLSKQNTVFLIYK